MDRFEFVSVIIAIVVGLALTNALTLWAELTRERNRVHLSYHFMSLSALLPVLLILHFQGFWTYRISRLDTALEIFLLMIPSMAQVLAIATLRPKIPDSDGEIDLGSAYFDNTRALYSFVLVYWLASMVPDLLILESLMEGWWIYNLYSLVFILTMLITKNRALHSVGLGALWLQVVASIAADYTSPIMGA